MRGSAEETKARILAAARERFGADGYERATIRAIAADAEIDPSMVIRYFGNKERLFAAAAVLDLRIPDLSGAAPEKLGFALTAHFLERWENDDAVKALLRAAATNEVAAEQVRQMFSGQIVRAVANLPGERSQINVRAGLVASQLMGMALCRYLLALPPVAAMDRGEIIAWLGPTIQRYLTGDPDRETDSPGREHS